MLLYSCEPADIDINVKDLRWTHSSVQATAALKKQITQHLGILRYYYSFSISAMLKPDAVKIVSNGIPTALSF